MGLSRIRQIGIILIATFLLSSCVELKGELGINSAARLTGEITYKIDKTLASSAGISSLDDVNRESNKTSTQQDGPCENQNFTEDSSDYILRCSLANSVSESGDISAQQIGREVFFRFKSNLDADPDSSRADFGTVSLTLQFADAVTSFKENKVGLVKRIDNFTYQISGYATEPMNIEIVANCGSRCGTSSTILIPSPTKTLSPEEAAKKAIEAANTATDAVNRAAVAAKKAAEDEQAKSDATRILEEARAQAAKILAEARMQASAQDIKTTITCIKGNQTKKVTAVKPKCPAGYKVSVASTNLPSAYDAKLKLGTKVKFGQAIPLAVPKCTLLTVKGKITQKCTFEKFVITINSFKFFDKRTPIGIEESAYAIDLKLENYSSRENGLDVGEFLKCKSSRFGSPFYSDGMNPQGVPAMSQDAGVVISSFPDEISIDKCVNPVLWIQLSDPLDIKDKQLVAEIKKKKLIGAAYIPLTPEMLLGS